MSSSPKKQPDNSFYKYTSMSFKMGAVITAGTYGGYRLDKWLQLDFPAFTLTLSLVSVALAMYIVIATTRN